MRQIEYKSGYKYQLHKTYTCNVNIYPDTDVYTEYIDLTVDGWLTIRSGYAWDGASGPTMDTKSSMRGALAHDALYQLLRHAQLDSRWREVADDVLYRTCREDGMSWIRAKAWKRAVNWFGTKYSLKKNAKKVEVAP